MAGGGRAAPRRGPGASNNFRADVLHVPTTASRGQGRVDGCGNSIFGRARKRALLEREGVPVGELEALAREHVRYIGSRTTKVFCFPTCHGARRIQEENRVPFRGAGVG